jgi:hypothetical protein
VTRRGLGATLGPLAIYVALSLVCFGAPLILHGDRVYLGSRYDPEILIWSFGWWPHALLNGENPFVTHAVWPVVGTNLAWVAAVPGLALIAAPVTLLAGPVMAYNVVTLALPALSAWTAFLLCRYITGSWWASLAGGYLFGFSSYMLGQAIAHMHMTSVFLVPLVALTVLQYLDARIERRQLALRLGLLFGCQVWLSTEVLATLTVAFASSLVTAYLMVPTARLRLRRSVPALLAAFVVACLVGAPLLGYAIADVATESINDPALFPADLLNLFVPTEVTLLGTDGTRSLSQRFVANITEHGAYLGLPLLLIVGWYGWEARHRPAGRLLVALLGLGILAELGVALHVAGHRIMPLPWTLVDELPGLIHVLPARFSMYVSLAGAVAAALWAASPRPQTWLRAGLVTVAVLALIPAAQRHLWQTTPLRPAFFAGAAYERCLTPNETVFVPDVADTDATIWQAESDFRFRLAMASLSPAIPSGLRDPEDARAVLFGAVPGNGRRLVRLARGLGATIIVLGDEQLDQWSPPLVEAGLEPVRVGGVTLYHLRPKLPTCNEASLT